MTRAPRAAPAGRPHVNDLLVGGLLALLAVGWLLSFLNDVPPTWGQALLVQSGKFSYALLALSATLGPLIGSPVQPKWLSAAHKAGWHGVVSGFALGAGLIHAAFALVGSAPFTLTEVLVPGAVPGRTFTPAAGSAGLWLTAFVYVSWALRKRVGQRLARTLHLLAYPAFAAVTLHAVWLGHGALNPLYALSAVAVAAALTLRLVTLARRPAPGRAAGQGRRRR